MTSDDGESWTYVDKTDRQTEDREVGEPSEGIVLYTEEGDPVRVCVMDENDERLKFVEKCEQGLYAYQGSETQVLVVLEKP